MHWNCKTLENAQKNIFKNCEFYTIEFLEPNIYPKRKG